MFGDNNIGSARVNLEGLAEGFVRDVWVPLEKVNSGELRLQLEAIRVSDPEGSRVCFACPEGVQMDAHFETIEMKHPADGCPFDQKKFLANCTSC